MAHLWAQDGPEAWQTALDGYAAALATVQNSGAKNKDRLVERDRWYQEALPKVLEQRADDPHITKQELQTLVDWKVRRGKFRGPLVGYARETKDAEVQAASRAAFAALRGGGGGGGGGGGEAGEAEIRAALDAMCVIRGVGPATASAILQAADPSVPFTSDEAMLAALGSRDYKVANVLQLAAALRGKAARLSEASGRRWTAKEVEHALYSAAVGAAQGGGGKGGGSKGGGGGGAASAAKKRKR